MLEIAAVTSSSGRGRRPARLSEPKVAPPFDGERVGGHVLGRQRHRRLHVATPIVGVCPRDPEHEVDGHVVEAGFARRSHGGPTGGGGCVRPRATRRRSSSACTPIRVGPRPPHAGRRAAGGHFAGVHLDGDSSEALAPEELAPSTGEGFGLGEGGPHRLHDATERVRPPQPRRAAAEVDGHERPRAGEPRRARRQLCDDGVGVGVVRISVRVSTGRNRSRDSATPQKGKCT